MAKQTTSTKQPVFQELKNTFHFFPFKNQTAPFIVIILLGLIFNLTSLYNEYALDDGIIIHQNDHVIKGISGIKGIMTKDAYESFYRRMNATDQLAGGRYRPLSVVSFAIEQEFIGAYKNGLYPANCWDTNENKINDPEEDLNTPSLSIWRSKMAPGTMKPNSKKCTSDANPSPSVLTILAQCPKTVKYLKPPSRQQMSPSRTSIPQKSV